MMPRESPFIAVTGAVPDWWFWRSQGDDRQNFPGGVCVYLVDFVGVKVVGGEWNILELVYENYFSVELSLLIFSVCGGIMTLQSILSISSSVIFSL